MVSLPGPATFTPLNWPTHAIVPPLPATLPCDGVSDTPGVIRTVASTAQEPPDAAWAGREPTVGTTTAAANSSATRLRFMRDLLASRASQELLPGTRPPRGPNDRCGAARCLGTVASSRELDFRTCTRPRGSRPRN